MVISGAAMQSLMTSLGWFSHSLPWAVQHLARASISAPDLVSALKRWCRHCGLADDIR
jgi:hypothetical protein